MNASDLQDVIGPDAQKLQQEANDAKLTTSSRLEQDNSDAIDHIKNALNARGILNSGETPYELDRQGTAYGQAQFDARSKLLDYLGQYQQGYVQAQQSKAAQLAQAYSDAATRQYNNNQGSAGATAQLDHVDSAGHAVYRGPDGRLYNSDGSAYSAPAAPPPPTPAAALPQTTYSSSPSGAPVRGPSIFSFK